MSKEGDTCPLCLKGTMKEEIFNRSVFIESKKLDEFAKVFIIKGSHGFKYTKEIGELHLCCNECPYGELIGRNNDPTHA